MIWAKKGKIKMIDSIMSVYRRHATNFTAQVPPRTEMKSYIRLFKLADRYFDFKYYNRIKSLLAFYYLKDARFATEEKMKKEALNSFIKAAKTDFRYMLIHLKSSLSILFSILSLDKSNT
jgi:hypothetical protein